MKKYKLINRRKKVETLCDKITIEGFDYYVNNNEIMQGDYYVDFRTDGNKLEHFKEKEDCVLVGICGSKKVIATTNPNIDLPKVVDEVEIPDYAPHFKELWLEGYKKSQETHSFSEEDMIEFAEYKSKNLMKHCDDKGMYLGNKKILQLWKEQTPITLYYD